MDELVQRLSEGVHAVEIGLRPDRTVQAMKECVDRGYVHVRFTGTRGGTELGVPVDPARSDFSAADFERGSGRCTVAGELVLNDVRVLCVADIELPAMTGTGRLEPVAAATA
jgi:hypothetical protein